MGICQSKYLIDESQNNYDLIDNVNTSHTMNDNENCQNVSSCKSVKRLREILHFLFEIENDVNNNKNDVKKLLLKHIEENKYNINHIINDYHHILLKHLNEGKQIKNDRNYEIINKKNDKINKL